MTSKTNPYTQGPKRRVQTLFYEVPHGPNAKPARPLTGAKAKAARKKVKAAGQR